jgi:hypothetical protein
MRVRNGGLYIYRPCLLDIADPPYGAKRGTLHTGDRVVVRNLHGCPPCNTMAHAHIETLDTDTVDGVHEFLGLVATASLHKE